MAGMGGGGGVGKRVPEGPVTSIWEVFTYHEMPNSAFFFFPFFSFLSGCSSPKGTHSKSFFFFFRPGITVTADWA